MANGEGSEEFVLLSKIRAGHRREFEFALRSQNEIGSCLGRTRVRKGVNGPNLVSEVPSSKKIKKPRKIPETLERMIGESEDELKSDVLDVMSDDENNKSELVESQRKEIKDSNGNGDGNGNGDDIVTDCDDEQRNDPVVEDEQMKKNIDSIMKENVVETVSNLVTPQSKTTPLKKNVPTKLKELLDTGLLEGLSVKYIRGCKRTLSDRGLAGIIRGTGILCFCDDCKGAQVVKPNQFELHAGSANKRPPDYIYLENGKTLRDVLVACKNMKQDSLTVTILNAIGSSSEKKSTFCLKCKGPMSEVSMERKTLLCSTCTELTSSQMTPSQATDSCERSHEPVSLPKPCKSAPKTSSSSTKTQGKLTRKDLRLHKLVFQDDFLPDGTELGYYVRGKKLLSGYKKGAGIFCYCCDTEVSPSQFEAHAGCASRRKPYLNIYTSNGASLHELSLTLSRTLKFSTAENDDLCSICSDAGDLLCCDGCPRAFHIECIPLSSIPQEKWYCGYCEDMFQKEKHAELNPNAIAAGRVPGVDPIEQINNRCIRIVKTLDTQDGGGCALCRAHDFSNSGFGPRTVIICDQCEKEYHVGCLREHKMHYLKEVPVGDWFCCPDCERIHSTLQQLVERGDQKLPDHLIDIIRKKLTEKGLNGDDLDVRWRVVNGRRSCLDEMRPLLSKVVSVFHEQFDPIHYGELKQDLIPHMVYGRNVKEREFGGMFCAVISVNSTIVSAGVFRVFGKELAEVPLVATSKDCQGQGYFQCLYSCIERLLGDLDVKNILLPAAQEARSLWINRFGFNVIPQEEFIDLRRRYALMMFDDTSMLHKLVPKSELES